MDVLFCFFNIQDSISLGVDVPEKTSRDHSLFKEIQENHKSSSLDMLESMTAQLEGGYLLEKLFCLKLIIKTQMRFTKLNLNKPQGFWSPALRGDGPATPGPTSESLKNKNGIRTSQ